MFKPSRACLLNNKTMWLPRSNLLCFQRILGVDFTEEGEIRPEKVLAETNTFQCLPHLVEQYLVPEWGEMQTVAARHNKVNLLLMVRKIHRNSESPVSQPDHNAVKMNKICYDQCNALAR